LSPKILIVRPGQRLSWQYHLRRSERWKILEGPALLHSSADDSPSALRHLATGDSVHLPTGERHRMEALERWAIAAEIWIHSDPLRPSDENDIVRIADDFGR
jgi:mannose-6-phosphate isomerase-like protein (cupin superfamily)